MATNKQILIIDDDITSLDLITYFFEQNDYEAVRCADGHVAIEFVKKNIPDLILVDLMMPGIDGIQTVTEIRKIRSEPIPIIAFTAVDDPDVHQKAYNAGCDELLTKPCPTERLMRTIKKHLNLTH